MPTYRFCFTMESFSGFTLLTLIYQPILVRKKEELDSVVEYRADLRRRPLLFARLEVLTLPSRYVYFAHCDIHGNKIKILGKSNFIIKIFKGYNNYCANSKKIYFVKFYNLLPRYRL